LAGQNLLETSHRENTEKRIVMITDMGFIEDKALDTLIKKASE